MNVTDKYYPIVKNFDLRNNDSQGYIGNSLNGFYCDKTYSHIIEENQSLLTLYSSWWRVLIQINFIFLPREIT